MSTHKKTTKPYSQWKEPRAYSEEAAVHYQTLCAILGGRESIKKSLSDPYDLIALSRNGIKTSSLKSLANYLGITMETMGGLLQSSYRNIQRKEKDALLDTLKTEKVLELATFTQRGIQVIGDKESFQEWLHSPLVALGNKTPLHFLDTTFGIQMVTRLLGRLEQGVYS